MYIFSVIVFVTIDARVLYRDRYSAGDSAVRKGRRAEFSAQRIVAERKFYRARILPWGNFKIHLYIWRKSKNSARIQKLQIHKAIEKKCFVLLLICIKLSRSVYLCAT